jgi:UDP-2,3-diacylglucosamine hydrolase
VPDYILSDVHLRLDRPERGERLSQLVNAIDPERDLLFIVGDLCDFWYQARQRKRDWQRCAGLRALRSFREAGGGLTVTLGNHDAWLAEHYREVLGIQVAREPITLCRDGLRVHLEHGHRRGAVSPWKWAMESRLFLFAFEWLPEFAARFLERALDQSNESRKATSEAKHLARYRRFAAELRGRVDLVALGHVHQKLDSREETPRLVVLGDWIDGSPYLVIDHDGAKHTTLEAMPVRPRKPLFT